MPSGGHPDKGFTLIRLTFTSMGYTSKYTVCIYIFAYTFWYLTDSDVLDYLNVLNDLSVEIYTNVNINQCSVFLYNKLCIHPLIFIMNIDKSCFSSDKGVLFGS